MKFSTPLVLSILALTVTADINLDQARAHLYKQIDTAAEKYYDAKGDLKDNIFDSWSNSQVKEWADAHGLKAPQASKKDELKSFARRHSKLLKQDLDQYSKQLEQAKAKFHKQVDLASQDLYDKSGKIKDNVMEQWSNSQLKAFADVHGLDAPQANDKDKVKAFARRHKKLLQSDVDDYINQASKTAQPYLSKATEAIAQAGNEFFDSSVEMWQDSKLRAFLDARGITTPANNRQKLLQLVKENSKTPASVFGSWSFENWSTEDLQKWLKQQGEKAQGTRDELLKAGSAHLSKAKENGEDNYNKAIENLKNGVDSYKSTTFDKWSDSDLKAYLDTYGIKTYQGTKRNEMISQVRNQYHLFTHGADPAAWGKLSDSFVSSGYQMLNNLQYHGGKVFDWGTHKAKQIYHKAAGAAEGIKADL